MRLLTIGGAMIDTVAIINSERIERMVMLNANNSFLLLEEGSKIEADEVSMHCGGGGVNAAVAMARLGLDVSTLIKVGTDQRAEKLLNVLMSEGVSTRWVMRDHRAPTGASVLIASHDRNAGVFTFRGANTLFEVEDLRAEAFATDFVYIANLSSKSAELFPAIVERAKASGARVAVNPGLRQLSAYWADIEAMLGKIDILTINQSEACAVVPHLVARTGEGGPALDGDDLPPLAARGLRGGGFEMSLAGFVTALTDRGLRYVVITDGGRGAYVGTAEAILYCPVLPCDVKGTTGAGDAFAATFTAATALAWPLEDALRAAAINAAAVVGYVDTQTGLLKREDLAAQLRARVDDLPIRQWGLASVEA